MYHPFWRQGKISWLPKINCSDSGLGNIYEPRVYENLRKPRVEYANTLMERIPNPLWKDMLKHYTSVILYAVYKCW